MAKPKIKIVTVEIPVSPKASDQETEKLVGKLLHEAPHGFQISGTCVIPYDPANTYAKSQLALLVEAATEARRYLDKTPCARLKEDVLRLLDKALK